MSEVIEKTIEELRQEATDLGITFNDKIGAEKLKLKIEEFYKAQSEVGQKQESKPAVKGIRTMRERANDAKALALKTHVVVITDNDQRENNVTQIVSVNCSNKYFDLGTKRIPLNVPVELEQGFINVLNEILIPGHVRVAGTGQSTDIMRRRYSIAYQDELKQA